LPGCWWKQEGDSLNVQDALRQRGDGKYESQKLNQIILNNLGEQRLNFEVERWSLARKVQALPTFHEQYRIPLKRCKLKHSHI